MSAPFLGLDDTDMMEVHESLPDSVRVSAAYVALKARAINMRSEILRCKEVGDAKARYAYARAAR